MRKYKKNRDPNNHYTDHKCLIYINKILDELKCRDCTIFESYWYYCEDCHKKIALNFEKNYTTDSKRKCELTGKELLKILNRRLYRTKTVTTFFLSLKFKCEISFVFKPENNCFWLNVNTKVNNRGVPYDKNEGLLFCSLKYKEINSKNILNFISDLSVKVTGFVYQTLIKKLGKQQSKKILKEKIQ